METKAKPRRRRPVYSFIFMSFWAFLAVLFAAHILNQAGTYNRLQSELAVVLEELDNARATIEDLEMRLLFFDTYAHIERLARERLGMVRHNEIVFVNTAN